MKKYIYVFVLFILHVLSEIVCFEVNFIALKGHNSKRRESIYNRDYNKVITRSSLQKDG
jgi:hypothetical protein